MCFLVFHSSPIFAEMRFIRLIPFLIFMTPLSFRVSIVVDFFLHQEYYAKEQCINRSTPGSCCQGSCHLKKELSKTNDGDKSKTINWSGLFKQNLQDADARTIPYSIIFLVFDISHSVRPCFWSNSWAEAPLTPPPDLLRA